MNQKWLRRPVDVLALFKVLYPDVNIKNSSLCSRWLRDNRSTGCVQPLFIRDTTKLPSILFLELILYYYNRSFMLRVRWACELNTNGTCYGYTRNFPSQKGKIHQKLGQLRRHSIYGKYLMFGSDVNTCFCEHNMLRVRGCEQRVVIVQ